MLFSSYTVITEDDTFVAIKFIESIKSVRDDIDLVADRLKDDIVISITMSSGTKHIISVKRQMLVYPHCTSSDLENTHRSILDQWIRLLGT